MQKKYWMGTAPTQCQTCSSPIESVFFDARTPAGWACMCEQCQKFGPGLGKTGTGLGQKYELQEDGKWLKTEG